MSTPLETKLFCFISSEFCLPLNILFIYLYYILTILDTFDNVLTMSFFFQVSHLLISQPNTT